MHGFFYNLGKMVGPKLRKAKWVASSLTGTEAEAVQAEYEVGRDLAVAFVQQMEIERHPDVQQMLDEIGAKLAGQVENRQRKFCFRMLKAPEVNAYALPGGFVFVTRPLLDLCRWDHDETAFVLGHEMAHVIRLHAIDRMMANSFISGALMKLPIGRGVIGAPVTGLMTTLLSQGYSQEQELDADKLGVSLAGQAGYDATAATRLLSRLGSMTGDPTLLGSYFSAHPPVHVRIENVNRFLKS